MDLKRSCCYVKAGLMVLAVTLAGLSVAPGQESLEQLKRIEAGTRKVVREHSAATVAIITEAGDTGTGVIVNDAGLVLTASHVVQGEERVAVIFENGTRAYARVLGANYTRDAAMVQLEGKGPWPHVELGDSDKMKVGDFVVALGHAKGFDPARRAPVRLGRLYTDGKQRFMISECTLIGGDSGGPLFDLDGRLVGIHSSIGPALFINNHVPVNAFKADWERLVRGQKWGLLGLHPMDDPQSPALGCLFGEIMGVDGVVVADVVVGSPADKAGLQAGDVITQIGDRLLENTRDLTRELGRHKPGEKADLVVYRRGEAYKTTLTFASQGEILRMMQH